MLLQGGSSAARGRFLCCSRVAPRLLGEGSYAALGSGKALMLL